LEDRHTVTISAFQAREEMRVKQIREAASPLVEQAIMPEDHYELGPNEHTNRYIDMDRVFVEPHRGWQLSGYILEILPLGIAGEIEVVAGPVTNGAVIANYMATQLASQKPHPGPVVYYVPIRRDTKGVFYIKPMFADHLRDKKVLLVDDVLRRGETLNTCRDLVASEGGSVIALAVVADRGGLRPDVHRVWNSPRFKSYYKAECPMCADGIPIKRFDRKPR
jgi:adenine/guanine phosphoribosyltransferase-like PRPP-binding protein